MVYAPHSPPFRRLLIANRGEVALRVARAAADLGIPMVAVYAPEDSGSLHLRHADSSVPLSGKGVQAYLDVEGIIAAARSSGCDAVHPGYGFLSENATFARRCAEEGFTFIGPRPEVLDLFGDKAAARRLAVDLDIPLAQGSMSAVSLAQASAFMEQLPRGRSAILKAVAGGGGRGMRVVGSIAELPQLYGDAASEARSAFGLEDLYIEEMISPARHVEVQVAGDSEGRAAHFHDRECSLQRRHQKLVEIAPAQALDTGMRVGMQTAAIKLAEAARVHTLCTFEFLVDLEAPGRFVFMEANPRLQVEHTVTEEVTGIDLVRTQILLAAGSSLASLGLLQRDVPTPRGTAVQMRINMEGVGQDGSVMPSGGQLTAFDVPTGMGIRIETMGYCGYVPPPSFDSLLAKLIVYTRNDDLREAIQRAYRALGEFRVEGVQTNIPFLQNLLSERAVSEGLTDTLYVTRHAARLAATGSHRSLSARASGASGAAVQQEVAAPAGSHVLRAPMGGRVIRLEVGAGDAVHRGRRVAVVEAMKMEHAIESDLSGWVLEWRVRAGDDIAVGEPLLFVEPGEVQASDDLSSQAIDLAASSGLESLRARRRAISDAGRPDAVAAQHRRGALTARERISTLCDAGSFVEFGGLVRNHSLPKDAPADGLVAGSARIDGRHVIVLAQDFTVFGGSSGHLGQDKMMRAAQHASLQGLPLVMLLDGGGHRIQDGQNSRDYASATPLFRELARISGWVPVVSAVMGFGFAANTNFSGMADLVLMIRGHSTMGLAGPALVKAGTGEDIDNEALGGATVQVERHGLADLAVDNEQEAFAAIRRFLSFLPSNARAASPVESDFATPDTAELANLVPANTRRSYDVVQVIEHLVDVDSILAFRPAFAASLFTCFARMGGRSVGIVANQPLVRGGTLDAVACEKAARFIALCDAFGLPLIFLVDIPGMQIGSAAEATMLGRRSAKVLFELGHISVPRISVVLRKAYGLGYLAMCGGRSFDADACLAWPTAEVCAMSVEGSVDVAYRKVYASDPDPRAKRDQLISEIRSHIDPLQAAEGFGIDDLIEPSETRDRLLDLLMRLPTRRQILLPPKFRAIPPV
jgi:acetyl/propionyl-CoA carboxylase alpha subunit/acetyl-CoA carboxylase carboxyltransferase component